MRVVINAKHLAKALNRLKSIIAGRSKRDIAMFLNTVWFRAKDGVLTIQANDGGALEGEIAMEADVTKDGFFGVELRHLARLAPKLDGDITVELQGEDPVFTCGEFVFRPEPRENSWYQPQTFEALECCDLPVAVLRDWLANVAYCISDEGTMEAMGCLCLAHAGGGTVHALGLDGHQFAMVERDMPELAEALDIYDEPLLIRKSYLKTLAAWLTGESVRVEFGRREVRFVTSDGSALTLPRSFYIFPDYMNFVGKLSAAERTLTVDRRALAVALSRLFFFTTDTDRCVFLNMEEGRLKLSSGHGGKSSFAASMAMPAVNTGPEYTVAFPTRDLLDILGHFKGESVALSITSQEGPCGITCEDEPGHLVILMPMKIVEETFYDEEAA